MTDSSLKYRIEFTDYAVMASTGTHCSGYCSRTCSHFTFNTTFNSNKISIASIIKESEACYAQLKGLIFENEDVKLYLKEQLCLINLNDEAERISYPE